MRAALALAALAILVVAALRTPPRPDPAETSAVLRVLGVTLLLGSILAMGG